MKKLLTYFLICNGSIGLSSQTISCSIRPTSGNILNKIQSVSEFEIYGYNLNSDANNNKTMILKEAGLTNKEINQVTLKGTLIPGENSEIQFTANEKTITKNVFWKIQLSYADTPSENKQFGKINDIKYSNDYKKVFIVTTNGLYESTDINGVEPYKLIKSGSFSSILFVGKTIYCGDDFGHVWTSSDAENLDDYNVYAYVNEHDRDEEVSSLYMTQNNILYIGSNLGLYWYSKADGDSSHMLISGNIYCIVHDTNSDNVDNVFAGTKIGIYLCDTKSAVSFLDSINTVYNIISFSNKDGKFLLIGTNKNLLLLDINNDFLKIIKYKVVVTTSYLYSSNLFYEIIREGSKTTVYKAKYNESSSEIELSSVADSSIDDVFIHNISFLPSGVTILGSTNNSNITDGLPTSKLGAYVLFLE